MIRMQPRVCLQEMAVANVLRVDKRMAEVRMGYRTQAGVMIRASGVKDLALRNYVVPG